MTARKLALAAAFVAATAVVPGCGPARLDVNTTAELSMGNPKGWDLPAVSQPQTVTVDYDSDPAPVEVGIWKKTDIGEGMPDPKKALKFDKDKAKGSLSVEVPADTPTYVEVGSLKGKTKVQVHISNRK